MAVARFAEVEGITIIGEFVEAETGKGADALDRRPQRAAARPFLSGMRVRRGGRQFASRYHGVAPEEADWSAPELRTRAVILPRSVTARFARSKQSSERVADAILRDRFLGRPARRREPARSRPRRLGFCRG
jgi:hypothetical protein